MSGPGYEGLIVARADAPAVATWIIGREPDAAWSGGYFLSFG